MTQGPQVAAPGRVHDGYNIDSTVQMLTHLTAEARTMVLATMPETQRWKILEAMRDDERADIVIAAGLGLRASMKKNIDPRLWGRTMDVIKNHSSYGAR
jgi:Mg/Co/Ni transporter MgtE